MSEKTTFLSTVPIMATGNLDQSVEFYTQKLGFSLVNRFEEAGYLIFERGGVYLHLSRYDTTPETNPFTCYIYVENIEPLYQEYQAAGAVHPNGPLETKPYGVREFAVLDNSGNCLRIGQRV